MFKLKSKKGKAFQMEGSKIWLNFGGNDLEIYHILGTVDELVNLANFPASRPGSALGFNPKLHPVKPTDIEEEEEVEAEYMEEKSIGDVNLYDDDEDEDDDEDDEEDYY